MIANSAVLPRFHYCVFYDDTHAFRESLHEKFHQIWWRICGRVLINIQKPYTPIHNPPLYPLILLLCWGPELCVWCAHMGVFIFGRAGARDRNGNLVRAHTHINISLPQFVIKVGKIIHVCLLNCIAEHHTSTPTPKSSMCCSFARTHSSRPRVNASVFTFLAHRRACVHECVMCTWLVHE